MIPLQEDDQLGSRRALKSFFSRDKSALVNAFSQYPTRDKADMNLSCKSIEKLLIYFEIVLLSVYNKLHI